MPCPSPKYCKQRLRDLAYVTLGGQRFYLGKYGTRASKREYDRLIEEWLANGRRVQPLNAGISVAELCLAYWQFAKGHYRKNRKPTDQLATVKITLRWLKELHRDSSADKFGPLAVKGIQDRMVERDGTRQYANLHTANLRQVFKWAAGNELIDAPVYERVRLAGGLQKGRTESREKPPVLPVPDSDIEATVPRMSSVVADMVRLQRLTGMRPAEVTTLRPCDVDRSDEIWTYTPESHKAEHHGRERVVPIGPKGQAVLLKYLLRDPQTFCFYPRDAVKERYAKSAANRRTPLSCGRRPGTNRGRQPKRKARERYDTNSYRRAVHRACKKAGVDKSSPNRLRHTAATEIRRKNGLEAVLGHSQAFVTQMYAERDFGLAKKVAACIG